MESLKLAEEITSKVSELVDELSVYVSKQRKASAKRARKVTLELGELFKKFRKVSVSDSAIKKDE